MFDGLPDVLQGVLIRVPAHVRESLSDHQPSRISCCTRNTASKRVVCGEVRADIFPHAAKEISMLEQGLREGGTLAEGMNTAPSRTRHRNWKRSIETRAAVPIELRSIQTGIVKLSVGQLGGAPSQRTSAEDETRSLQMSIQS